MSRILNERMLRNDRGLRKAYANDDNKDIPSLFCVAFFLVVVVVNESKRDEGIERFVYFFLFQPSRVMHNSYSVYN